jgi:hypothetical protein
MLNQYDENIELNKSDIKKKKIKRKTVMHDYRFINFLPMYNSGNGT